MSPSAWACTWCRWPYASKLLPWDHSAPMRVGLRARSAAEDMLPTPPPLLASRRLLLPLLLLLLLLLPCCVLIVLLLLLGPMPQKRSNSPARCSPPLASFMAWDDAEAGVGGGEWS